MEEPINTTISHYRILSKIGAGGMGEVYRARDTRLNREVAIKVLPASFANDADRLRRFEQEARATSALNHPNILTVHDIGNHEGTPYIVAAAGFRSGSPQAIVRHRLSPGWVKGRALAGTLVSSLKAVADALDLSLMAKIDAKIALVDSSTTALQIRQTLKDVLLAQRDFIKGHALRTGLR